MPISFRCPHCSRSLAIGTRKAGAQIACPVCAGTLTVPAAGPQQEAPPTAATEPADAWWVDAPVPASLRPSPLADAVAALPSAVAAMPSRSPRASPQRARLLAGTAATGVLILAGVLALAWSLNSEEPTPPQSVALTPQAPPPAPLPAVVPVAAKQPAPKEQPAKPILVVQAPTVVPIEPVKEPDPLPKPPAPVTPPIKSQPLVQTKPAPARPTPLVVKHRRDLSEAELHKQISGAPEIMLDRSPERHESRQMVVLARKAKAEGRNLDIGPPVLKQRADTAGLPMRMGDACHLDPTTAEHLEGGSLALRAHMSTAVLGAGVPGGVGVGFVAGDTRPDPKKLDDALRADGDRHSKWLCADAVPALQQLLMAEIEAIRSVLVDQLARIEGKRASVALAQRALFDLSPEIRKSALEALRKRPVEEYRQTLLDGFQHPWTVVADHAAESLVALGLTDTVPTLLSLLDQANPAEPATRPGKEGLYVREMVRINHLHNCLMCHAASLEQSDRVRGRVPSTDQPLPPPFTRQYYADTTGTFVRADVTYLQQDFSVPLPVKNPGKWPDVQRYDFLVRERPATLAEMHNARTTELRPPSEHLKAIFFALRELTGSDPGPTAEDWKRLFLGRVKVTPRASSFQAIAGLAADGTGRIFVSDTETLYRIEKCASPVPLVGGAFKSLALDTRGRLLACQGARVVALDTTSGAVSMVADRWRGQPLVAPQHLAADRQGGVYFTDAPQPSLEITADKGAVYYASAQGVVTRLPISLNRPTAIALSADDKTLYLLTAGSADVMAYPLEGTGLPKPGRVLCRLEARDGETRGGSGLTVDSRGNLFVTNPAARAMAVFNAQGACLGLAPLTGVPLHCAVGGEGGRTLYVATRTAVFTVQVEATGIAAR